MVSVEVEARSPPLGLEELSRLRLLAIERWAKQIAVWLEQASRIPGAPKWSQDAVAEAMHLAILPASAGPNGIFIGDGHFIPIPEKP